ncbi:MAG: hypothetical protein AAGA56_09195 [Myxococcota bacterium]
MVRMGPGRIGWMAVASISAGCGGQAVFDDAQGEPPPSAAPSTTTATTTGATTSFTTTSSVEDPAGCSLEMGIVNATANTVCVFPPMPPTIPPEGEVNLRLEVELHNVGDEDCVFDFAEARLATRDDGRSTVVIVAESADGSSVGPGQTREAVFRSVGLPAEGDSGCAYCGEGELSLELAVELGGAASVAEGALLGVLCDVNPP